ncbi:MAG: flagellar basal body-associated FliL family protein [Micavibrio sp.]|nr:flagellar basal body-associated FliL family protein [Micavibrio sp.]|tara:strand:- start:402 stop:869 length:468 start_codon:yes stop_codon:yes gene_type:complete
MRLIFILLMGVVILAGAGIGYFMFLDESVAGYSEPGEDSHAQVAEEDPMALQYVELDALILPIINDNGVSQTISVVVTIEVDSQEKFDLVEHVKPRLADAFLRDMYGALSRQATLHGGVVKVDALKNRLKRVSKKVMGEEVVNDVLLQLVHQKRV